MRRRLTSRRHQPEPIPVVEVTVDLRGQYGAADHATVTDNMNTELATIDDPDRLAALLTALDALGDGWHQPAQGVPIPKLRINFAEGDRPRGNLGIGRTFLAAHVHGGFLARASDEETSRGLLRAAGVGHLWARLQR